MEFKSHRSTNSFSAYFAAEFQCDCFPGSGPEGDALGHQLHGTLSTFADMESQSFKNLHLLDNPLLLQKDTESYLTRMREIAGKYMGYPRTYQTATKGHVSDPSISLSTLLSACGTLDTAHRIVLFQHLNSNDMVAQFLSRVRQQFPQIFPVLARILALLSEYHRSMGQNLSLIEVKALGEEYGEWLVQRVGEALGDLGVKKESVREVARGMAVLGLELLEGWL